MSVNESMVLLRDVRKFSVGAAEFIALEVASGASVKELHEHHEDMVPSPLVVNRWRKNVPAFDLLMKEAEEAKAQGLADEVITIAKDEDRQAAISGNMIKARQWLSGQLSESFRNGKTGSGGTVLVEGGLRLSDEQLMKIAQGSFNGNVIQGEALDVRSEDTERLPSLAEVESETESGGEGSGGENGSEELRVVESEGGAGETESGSDEGIGEGVEGGSEESASGESGGWDFI